MTEVLQQFALPKQTAQSSAEQASCDAGFSELVRRQTRFVFRVAYSIVRNAQDSEDVVQETFLKLYRQGNWKSIQDERAYLARAAWRLAVARLRPLPSVATPENQAGGSPDPEQATMSADNLSMLHRLIDALPEELRQPLALSAVEDLTATEIGAVLGIPPGTVRSRLSRARQILRQKLQSVSPGGYGY